MNCRNNIIVGLVLWKRNKTQKKQYGGVFIIMMFHLLRVSSDFVQNSIITITFVQFKILNVN